MAVGIAWMLRSGKHGIKNPLPLISNDLGHTINYSLFSFVKWELQFVPQRFNFNTKE